MRLHNLHCALLCCLFLPVACDDSGKSELDMEKTKSVYELKQAPKGEMSKEELEEARRKAGFKSQDEQMEEAKAAYDKMERGYIKGKLEDYRGLLADIGKKLDDVEKNAPKWADAKKGEGAFNKFNDKHKKATKALIKSYDDLTEKGSRGGNTQVEIDKLVTGLENLNNDLGPKISEAEGFATTLKALRDQADVISKTLEEIEKDESITAETSEEDGDDKKTKKKGK